MPFSLEENNEWNSTLLTQLLTDYLEVQESNEIFIYDHLGNKITL